MKNPDFAAAYAELEPEMNVIRAIVDTRIAQNLMQKELAEKTGIAQTEISRIENGTRNPSLKILQRLADGMDMVLKVSFEPKKKLKPNKIVNEALLIDPMVHGETELKILTRRIITLFVSVFYFQKCQVRDYYSKKEGKCIRP